MAADQDCSFGRHPTLSTKIFSFSADCHLWKTNFHPTDNVGCRPKLQSGKRKILSTKNIFFTWPAAIGKNFVPGWFHPAAIQKNFFFLFQLASCHQWKKIFRPAVIQTFFFFFSCNGKFFSPDCHWPKKLFFTRLLSAKKIFATDEPPLP